LEREILKLNYKRILDIYGASERRSVFLLGPRATGKSTLLRQCFPQTAYYDLLDARVYGSLLRNPNALAEETSASSLTIIDEIQKLPSLLDEVHRLISTRQQRFILTGSSARKIKRGAANLLAGRARQLNMFPLVSKEIENFDLISYLNTGGLPQIYGDPEAHLDLRSYVDLYLREEIQAEALTRNVASFASVLDALALMNGQEINATSIASDTGVQARTILNFIEIMEDTLIAFRLPVFQKTKKRKPTSRSKIYFFDVGVTNTLCHRKQIAAEGEMFGPAFEHFLMLEVRSAISYKQADLPMSFWRTSAGFEVDLILGDEIAIEFKSSRDVSDKHLKGMRALKEEKITRRHLVVSQNARPRLTEDGIEILPWADFLNQLWVGDLFR
jgi:predicted AAA+ superfamily ATPase